MPHSGMGTIPSPGVLGYFTVEQAIQKLLAGTGISIASPGLPPSISGLRDGNYLRTYDDIGIVGVEHDVNSHISIRNQTQYANFARDAPITEAQIPSGVTLATQLNAINVNRHEISVNSAETFLDNQLDASEHGG